MKGGSSIPDRACRSKDIDEACHSQNEVNLLDNAVSSSANKTPPADEKVSFQNDLNFTIQIYKDIKICIYKPLLPLKLTLFFMFGAGAPIATFISVYLKQQGVTLAEFSTVNMLIPVVQSIAPTVSGIIADKLGRSKPVFVVNLLLTVIFVIGLLLVPRMSVQSSGSEKVILECHRHEFDKLISETSCSRATDFLKLEHCNISCSENTTRNCYEDNLICDILARNEDFDSFTLSVYINGTFEEQHKCYYIISSIVYYNVSYYLCNLLPKMHCSVECFWDSKANATEENGNRTKHVIALLVILTLFYTVFSNCYRILDVTSMSLVKEHNSDFGRQRFFSILGILVFLPIAGAIATAAKGAEKNYASVFYLFFGLTTLSLALIYKLDVRINPPGKQMLKKSLKLIKNPDDVVFFFVVFVLGTAWCFKKYFIIWYLEDLNAPSILLGIVPAMSGLYGLPFLCTSKWWVKKIGTNQIFLLGLLAYVICGAGYSFLTNPWFSLILEATDIFSYHLLWVAVITHSHNIAPEGLTATVIATAGAIHFSLGKASGSLIGGMIMNSFGGRKANRVMAIICFITASFYGLYLYMRGRCCSKKVDTNETHDNEL